MRQLATFSPENLHRKKFRHLLQSLRSWLGIYFTPIGNDEDYPNHTDRERQNIRPTHLAIEFFWVVANYPRFDGQEDRH